MNGNSVNNRLYRIISDSGASRFHWGFARPGLGVLASPGPLRFGLAGLVVGVKVVGVKAV
jgi:hypothetical protein